MQASYPFAIDRSWPIVAVHATLANLCDQSRLCETALSSLSSTHSTSEISAGKIFFNWVRVEDSWNRGAIAFSHRLSLKQSFADGRFAAKAALQFGKVLRAPDLAIKSAHSIMVMPVFIKLNVISVI